MSGQDPALDPERLRMAEAARGEKAWAAWGPYLSERQWGTVREDYSRNGDAWNYLSHDQARSKAYRWGEDGIGGLCDDHQRLCLAVALWNGQDAILKERMFGLTNLQGNHGEDVKELYYFLDATPTHSWLRMLYKYPQSPFPYERLIEENAHRGLDAPEFELIDTGVFDNDHYFDVDIAYAKADVDDILMRITVVNRAAAAAALHVLPQLWFRNTWSWEEGSSQPSLVGEGAEAIAAEQCELGRFVLRFEGAEELLFCANETNLRRLYGVADAVGPFKDAFHEAIIRGDRRGLSSSQTGTKACAVYRRTLGAGASWVIRLRLRRPEVTTDAFQDFDQIFAARLREADLFYRPLEARIASAEERRIQRQALAGMIWTKQSYHYDVSRWLDGDPAQPPPPPERRTGRNSDWRHLLSADVISMPDTWEYPWFASWDVAFHAVVLARIDPGFAKSQMTLLGHEWYMHPNGELPAYEWNFGDVNPPVRAWAAWQVYEIERHSNGGQGDLQFLERMLHKFLLNFTWWVNRKDHGGRNIFQGGFLGLDNIGCFDRSAKLPTGGYINQSDGTAWMAMYALNLMRIALELGRTNHVYEDLATKFFEHFLAIAEAMVGAGREERGLWDEEDNFYYDVLDLFGKTYPLKVRSIVGLIPLLAVEILDGEHLEQTPDFADRLAWYLDHRPDLARLVSRWNEPGQDDRRLLSLVRAFRLKKTLARMLDPEEFLSPYGIRALSRAHLKSPFAFEHDGHTYGVHYVPGESDSRLFGGNSNWRGPIWMPINYLIIQSLRRFHAYYGDDFQVECPTGSGTLMSLNQVADELARRLAAIFLPDGNGRRAVFGAYEKLQTDPHFRDHLLFFEYFDGDSGRGCGASHQTGWTGLIAKLVYDLHNPT